MASVTTEVEVKTAPNGASSSKEKLTLVSGSFYLPKDSNSKPLGDDAHFICMDKQTIGLADGVGGWSQKGIDSGVYARELITNAEIAVQTEPNNKIDPASVLNEAYSKTKAEGASTACIITLQDNRLHAVNVGDSGFILIRKGADIYQSPIQQHYFNCPYQLQNDKSSNSPNNAQELTIPVQPGDIIVAGTDGLFDNLFATQIEEVTRLGIEQGLDPQDVAWAVAQQAHYVSTDRDAFTPYMQASINAQHSHLGGKVDDITVIVSYVVSAKDAFNQFLRHFE